ncbi:hypothetical protein ACFSQJ_03720 [Croceitalea marina]|uniref:Collagen-like protein n=1 Tax=Croceitalea marina TaxID=1775166 RepID=A0ABW5MUK8_9FLAO
MKNFHKTYYGLKHFFSVLLPLLAITACSDGDAGLEGLQGPQGEQGEAGEVGPTGTVDFFYSDWIPSELENPLPNGLSGFNIDSQQFTSLLKENGALFVYAQLTSKEVTPLPFENPLIGQAYNFSITDDDQLRILVVNIAEMGSTTPLIESVRYIIIPGTEQETGKAPAQDFSKMSYSEVAQYFGITD